MSDLLEYFKEEAYEAFLMEDLAKTYNDVLENQTAIFEAMDSYVKLIELEEEFSKLTEATEINLDTLNDQLGKLKDIFTTGAVISDKPTPSDVTYYPTIKEITAPSKADSFAAFINAIVTWIKNVFVALVTKIANVLKRLTGAPTKEIPDVSIASLLQKQKAALTLQKIEDANNAARFGNITYLKNKDAKVPVDVVDPKSEQIEFLTQNKLTEDLEMTLDEALDVLTEKSFEDYLNMPTPVEGDMKADPRSKTGQKVNPVIHDGDDKKKVALHNTINNYVLIDPSKDLFDLKEALNQFFLLFDNSIGSNGEKLFETEDLTLLLKTFEATKSALDKGDVDFMAVGNKVSQFDLISADKLKDNLIRTKVNTDKLIHAYEQVDNMMQNVIQAISGKDYNLAISAPAAYKVLSAATYKEMIEIVKILNKRIAQAKKLEKKLEKVKGQYEKLANELSKMKSQWLSIGLNVSFSTVTQQRISNLFDAAKYVLQTIMLRYGALGIYTKVLENTKGAISNLNFINSRISANPFVRPFSKVKYSF